MKPHFKRHPSGLWYCWTRTAIGVGYTVIEAWGYYQDCHRLTAPIGHGHLSRDAAERIYD